MTEKRRELSQAAVREIVRRMTIAYRDAAGSSIGQEASAWHHFVGGIVDSVARAGLPKPEWCSQELWDSSVQYVEAHA